MNLQYGGLESIIDVELSSDGTQMVYLLSNGNIVVSSSGTPTPIPPATPPNTNTTTNETVNATNTTTTPNTTSNSTNATNSSTQNNNQSSGNQTAVTQNSTLS